MKAQYCHDIRSLMKFMFVYVNFCYLHNTPTHTLSLFVFISCLWFKLMYLKLPDMFPISDRLNLSSPCVVSYSYFQALRGFKHLQSPTLLLYIILTHVHYSEYCIFSCEQTSSTFSNIQIHKCWCAKCN